MISVRLTRAAYAYTALVCLVLGYFLMRIPIQVTDSLVNLFALDRPFLDLMAEAFTEARYFRPGLWAGLKVVYDLSAGDYFLWYRATQVVQVTAVIVLFVQLLDIRTRTALMVLPVAIAALLGAHTFAWTLREAFPINTFLTILVCCAAAARVSFAEHRWWTDLLAIAIFVFAAATLESGLLVLVVFVGGYLLGLRGVSRNAIAALLALLTLYLWVRFGLLDTGLPTLLDREAGFGFERRGGDYLTQRFGDAPLMFYAYNVVSSVLTVLTAEPRDGVWSLARSIVFNGRPDPLLLFASLSTTLSTALIVRFVWRRRYAWRARTFSREDCLVLLFFAVLGANAAISYAYTKDVIMSPAGFFFAAAVFVAMRDLIETTSASGRLAVAAATIVVCLVSASWAVRSFGLHLALAQTSAQVREQWVYIDDYLNDVGYDGGGDLGPSRAAMTRTLRNDALVRAGHGWPLRDEVARYFEIE